MDLSKLSDSDLDALESGDLTKLSEEGLSSLESGTEAPQGVPSTSTQAERDKTDASLDPYTQSLVSTGSKLAPEGGPAVAGAALLGSGAIGASVVAPPLLRGLGRLLQGGAALGKAASSPFESMGKLGGYLRGVGKNAPEVASKGLSELVGSKPKPAIKIDPFKAAGIATRATNPWIK